MLDSLAAPGPAAGAVAAAAASGSPAGSAALVLGGLACLTWGATQLVRGAAGLALGCGLPPLVVGLTVVAIGTSAPELAVTVGSALAGEPELAFGNVVGSNIANVLLILGVSAIVTPLAVARRLTRQEIPLMIGVSFLVAFLCRDGLVSRPEGLLLLAGFAAFTVVQLRVGMRGGSAAPLDTAQIPPPAQARPSRAGLLLDASRVALGLALLVVGAHAMVLGATDLARLVGLSDLVIGLTVVAVGTSLPEIATSLVAAWRGEGDIAVGNIVGSNIANLLLILGVAAVIAPRGIPVPPEARQLDVPVMLVTAMACLPVALDGRMIARWEGAFFAAYYAGYVAYLVLSALRHPLLGRYTDALVFFALPLSAVTLTVLLARGLRREFEGATVDEPPRLPRR